MPKFTKYHCPKCHGTFPIPPNATEITHICPILNNEKVTIKVEELQ